MTTSMQAYAERIAQLEAQETVETLTTRQVNTRARTCLLRHNINACASDARVSGKEAQAFIRHFTATFFSFKLN